MELIESELLELDASAVVGSMVDVLAGSVCELKEELGEEPSIEVDVVGKGVELTASELV